MSEKGKYGFPYLSHLDFGLSFDLRHFALEFAHGAQAAPHFAIFIDMLFGLSAIVANAN